MKGQGKEAGPIGLVISSLGNWFFPGIIDGQLGAGQEEAGDDVL